MFAVWLFTTCNLLEVKAQQVCDYVVVTSKKVQADGEWMKVVEALAKRHKATVLYYDKQPRELLTELRRLTPRYVAVVEKPENLNREFVMEGHRLSREIDDDIYADYLWGIITGYSAADAMRMIEGSAKPFVIHTALNTTAELSDGKYFDRFAFMNDGGTPGGWGEKTTRDGEVKNEQINKWEILNKWVEKYKEIDPDLLVTSSHATEKNLAKMPFTVGNSETTGRAVVCRFHDS